MAKIHKKFKQSKKILKGGAVQPHPPPKPNPRSKKVLRASGVVKREPIEKKHKYRTHPRPPRSFRIIRNSSSESSESSDNEYETEQKLKPKSKNTSSGSKSGSKSGSRSGSRSGSTLLRSKSI